MIGLELVLVFIVIAALAVRVATGEGGQAISDPAGEATARIAVTSTVIGDGQPIPERHSAYGSNESPPLQWTGAPGTTQSFAVVCEDPDAHSVKPFVHWVIYNIPGAIGVLDPGLPTSERLNHPTAAMQGKNSKGEVGYFGPRPPQGDPPHHYHFKVYALDELLELQPGLDRAQLFAAMKGHVIGFGELVGTFAPPG
jgi:Raf kinase inhibitor-like YbhB/YbcL family protein